MAFVPDEAVDRSHELTGAEFKLYVNFCKRRDKKTGVCWPSLRTSASDLKVDLARVVVARRGLVEKAWVKVESTMTEAGKKRTVITPLVGFEHVAESATSETLTKAQRADVTKSATSRPAHVDKSATSARCGKRIDDVVKTALRINRLNQPIEPAQEESSSSLTEQLLKPVTSKSLMSTASTAAREIGEHWKQRLNHPNAVLDSKRLKPVVAMLAYYSVDQLKRAVDGCAMSAFHMGANDNLKIYDDLSLICRDTEHVERFIDFTEGNGNAQRQQPRPAPLSKESQRLIDSFAGIARRAADEAGGDNSGVAQPARLALLR